MSATDAVKKYLAEIGGRGGAAGTGESKKRSPEFYAAISAKAAEKRSAEKAARDAAKAATPKRPRGRPKTDKVEAANAPKRPRGRPRKES